MRTTMGGLLVSLLIVLITVPARGGERRALFVGVSHHADERLDDPGHRYAEADAQALGDLFRTAGFDVAVLLGKEATTTAIKEQLEAIATMDGTDDDVVVVGFFGKGSEFDLVRWDYLGSTRLRWVDTALFCSYDAQTWRALKEPVWGETRRGLKWTDDGQEVWEPNPNTLFKFGQVIDALLESNAGRKLLLADCHVHSMSPGPVYPWGRSLVPEMLPVGTVAMFATHHPLDRPTEDAEWQHGAFTKAILDSCSSDPVITATELTAIVRRSVIRLAGSKGGRQAPRVLTSGVGDFDLPLPGLPRPPLPLPLPPSPEDDPYSRAEWYGLPPAYLGPKHQRRSELLTPPKWSGHPPAYHGGRRTSAFAGPLLLLRDQRDRSRYEMGDPIASWSILNSIPGADGESAPTAGGRGFDTTTGPVQAPAPAQIPNPVPSVQRGP